MTVLYLFALAFLTGCIPLAQPSIPPPRVPQTAYPVQVLAEATEAKALHVDVTMPRKLYASPVGNDRIPCAALSQDHPARNVRRAVECMKRGEEVIFTGGESEGAVHVRYGGKPGKPLRIYAERQATLTNGKASPVLQFDGPFTHIEGFLVEGDVLGEPGKGVIGQGLVLSRMAVRGKTVLRGMGTPVKDPGIAANILKFSAFGGPVTLDGYGFLVRASTFKSALVTSGGRHIFSYITAEGPTRWEAEESFTGNDPEYRTEFKGDLLITGSNAVFSFVDFNTVKIGEPKGKRVIGTIFSHCTCVTPVKKVNEKSTIFIASPTCEPPDAGNL